MLAAGSLTYVREPGYANPLNPTDSAEAMVASWPGQTITYICANSQGQLKNVTWDEDGKKTTCNVDVQLPVGVDIELSTLDIVKAEAGYPRSGVRGKMQYLYGTLLTNIVNNPDHSQAAKFRLNTAGQLN
jgi:hypothetical protein